MAVKNILFRLLTLVIIAVLAAPAPAVAQGAVRQQAQPVVAIHVSELTEALEKMPAAGTDTPHPPTTSDTSGTQWYYTSWHYFVMYESLMEALRSDGTPFVTVSDADIRGGGLVLEDGKPKYPILISLAAEAVSDEEIEPLRNYVDGGGYLFVGSSALTRRPDGSNRGDFALADEIGLHMVTPGFQNWYTNLVFSKAADHWLVSHIPAGKLIWKMPLSADQVSWGTAYYGHPQAAAHYDFKVRAAGATVIANGSEYPVLAVRSYGKGTFIYHADMQPLIGFGGPDSGMYAYGIYRNAIQQAFEAAGLPIIRLSPWAYRYDSAFIMRHDLENTAGQIIEASARAEFQAGAKGDYYFCTGVLRDQMKNDPTIIASLRRSVENYGATIGPHNGGLKNPANIKLTYANFDYWHWGPDEAMNGSQAGFDYALQSLTLAYRDIESWLAGTDNGRPGCGAQGNCPRIWVSPYFNSTREESSDILNQLHVVSAGEQKLSPFPHFTLSTQTEGLLYPQVSLPVSDWYINKTVAQSIESGHTLASVHALVDTYYNLGALVNLYGHASSASGLTNAYMLYSLSKPRMWAANSVEISEWWKQRAGVNVTPGFSRAGNTAYASAEISGATDPETAIEMAIPGWNQAIAGNLEVLLDGAQAGAESYRWTTYGIKIKVGSSTKHVTVRYTPSENWEQIGWTAPGMQVAWNNPAGEWGNRQKPGLNRPTLQVLYRADGFCKKVDPFSSVNLCR